MRHFVFGMEKLLRFRDHEERRARNTLAAANARCLRIEDQIVHLRSERTFGVVSTAVGMIDMSGYLAGVTYTDALEVQIDELQTQLKEAQGTRDEAAGKYRYYRRRASALQLLRQRRFEDWRRDYRRYETKLLDDISQARRNTATEGNQI